MAETYRFRRGNTKTSFFIWEKEVFSLCLGNAYGMRYFHYHGVAKRLIAEGKLIGFYYTDDHRGIRPALVLLFNDGRHPIMPIREHRWGEYQRLLPQDKAFHEPP